VDPLVLFLRHASMSFKTWMEYKYAFFTNQFVQFFTYGTNYLGIWILFDKFDSMKGWSFYEVVFLYSLNLLTYGLSGFFFWSPMKQLGYMVQHGDFDSILIRPMNPFFHMIARNFNTSFFVNIVMAGIVFGICFNRLGIAWSPANIFWLVIFIFGAFLVQCSMFIFGGSLSFWVVNSSPFINTFIYGIRHFVDYPISVYDTVIRALLTFVVPYAFVNFYPAAYFLNKSDDMLFFPALQYATPLVGVILFLLAYKVWSIGIRRYESTGS